MSSYYSSYDVTVVGRVSAAEQREPMSKDKELKERIAKIKKLQERQRRSASSASENAASLDEILAVSRAEHDGTDLDRPLRSASDLLGPGGRPARRRNTVDTESAFDRNMSAAHFASPEAFSRNRSKPPPVLGPGGAIAPGGGRSIQRPGQPVAKAPAQPSPSPMGGETSETTLVVRTRKTPLDAEPSETQVIRTRRIPRDAIGEDGSVQPTDHIKTLPGAGGRVDPNERTSPGAIEKMPPSETLIVRERKIPRDAIGDDGSVQPTDHIETLPGAGGAVDPYERTSPGNLPVDLSTTQPIERPKKALALPSNVRVKEAPQVEPTDHMVTAPGMAGLSRVTTTERTEVVRHRRLHPDSVDPNTGDVLPTDHVVTAPGMAGLNADPSEQTQVLSRAKKAQAPAEQSPEETMVVRKRKPPVDSE